MRLMFVFQTQPGPVCCCFSCHQAIAAVCSWLDTSRLQRQVCVCVCVFVATCIRPLRVNAQQSILRTMALAEGKSGKPLRMGSFALSLSTL